MENDTTNIKTPIEKLQNDLSLELDKSVHRQQKLSTALKVLSELKNNPVDVFGDKLTKEYEKDCMEKCKKILTTFS